MKTLQKISSCVCLALLLSLILLAGVAGLADYLLPDSISVLRDETPAIGAWVTLSLGEEEPAGAHATQADATAKLLGLLPVKEIKVTSYEKLSLCPGGGVFGIRAPLGGALVTSLSEVATASGARSPARTAGIKRGDLITAVNGRALTATAELSAAIAASEGRAITLTILRNGSTRSLSRPPCRAENGGWRAGLLVKDSVAGIGTVTFIDPETGAFGGLGHAVYDGIHDAPVAITRGVVTAVGLSGVTPGAAGAPGELRGHLESQKLGALLSNTDCGVFGVLAESPSRREAIPIGLRRDVTVGCAEILSTLADGITERYTIEITSLSGEKGSDKSFSIRVTDPRLLEKTGGIVQGMSGSPIIQNGKLVGAVTHVMINDPTAGYGIFIENMLSAAQMPRAKAS